MVSSGDSAEASSEDPARKAISFHPLHIKGLIVSCWRPLNGQIFRPWWQVRMWILHTKIPDGVQNGCQKDEFSNFSHIGVIDLHKYTYFYVILLRNNLKSIVRLENPDSNRFLGWSPKCYIPSFMKIGLPVLEKIFEWFLPYMGVAAILVM